MKETQNRENEAVTDERLAADLADLLYGWLRNVASEYRPEDFMSGEGHERVAYQWQLAGELEDPLAATYYAHMCSWWCRNRGMDGYLAKPKPDIERALMLTRVQQDRIRTRLERDGWLAVARETINGHQTLKYRPLRLWGSGGGHLVDSEKASYEELAARLEKLLFEIEMINQTIDDIPTSTLWRHASKRTGELPEMTGACTSTFAMKGDQIIDTRPFSQYHGDEQEFLESWNDVETLRRQRKDREREVREIRERMRTRMDER